MSNIYFCSFADTTMKASLDRIGKQAKSFKIFKKIFLYTEKELSQETKELCNKNIEKTGTRRGYGYWVWKPAIILETLNKIKDDDLLVYMDAGTHLNVKGIDKLKKYLKQADENDIWATKLSDNLNEKNYTKADTIELFRTKLPNEGVLLEGQIQSGNIILKKNKYTIEIINEWNKLMSFEHLHHIDDSPSIIPNPQTFQEHRHDQSIWSLLLKCNHYTYDPNCKSWAPDEEGWKILEATEPILNKRDKVSGQYLSFRDKLSIAYHKIRKIFGLE